MGYLKDSYNMSIKPLLDFASPVITPINNFLTSGSNYDANASAGSNFVNSFSTPSNLFDDTFMSDNMDLTYGGSEVPEFDGISSLPPVVINKNPNELYDPSTFANDTSPINEAAGYPNYYQQINPAGVTSADGMMTEPAMYLYPGEAIGIDGVPYRPSAGASTANSGGGNSSRGTAVANAVPSAPVLKTRTFPFTSRTPSGTVYAPDLSAYNNSSLFNYAGPGGLAEYTYGQGLRTDGADYSIFGSPANIANPYFSGQFKQPQGPADAAINMPAVELPEGVQPVTPTEVSADVSMPGFVSGGNPMVGGSLPSDLTYQQTIDEMGIFGPNNPPPSTLFPSPGQATANAQNTVAGNIAGSPDNSMMDNQAAADLAMGDRTGYPIDKMLRPDNSMLDNQAAANAAMGNRLGYPSTVPTTQQTMDMLQARANQVYDNMTAEEKRDGLFIEPVYSVSKDTMKLGIPDIFATNNENVSSTGNLINRTPPERNIFKADEIDIPTPPFRPEGVEGEDFYQDVTGSFFNVEDDLGTQPLVEPSMDSTFLNRETGTGDAISQTVLPRIEPFQPPRPDNDMTFGQAGRTAYDGRSAYEREGTEELTSNRMVYLDNAYDAIDAKYEGSETNTSQQAKLVEVLNANLNAFGSDAGRENAALAREQQSIRQANATPFIPSYAREQEGTDMAESLFQGVDTSPTNTVYPGENSIPFNPSNPIDQLVLQKTAQEAQVARAKYDNVPARAETSSTPISIFNVPAREPISMNQVKPMVARTQNNMTVPVMRDSALDKRYGGPMRYGL